MSTGQVLSHSQLTNLMLTGPTHKQRKLIWLEITGAKAQMRDNVGYYELLLTWKGTAHTQFSAQIDKDLQRTYPEEGFLAMPGAMQSLRNVLVAYSWRNPSIGYCQGMNFIAGRLLSFGFSEEQAFWMLAQILETYLPLDYFSVMTGVLTDQKVFHSLLKLHVPRVAKHLQQHSIDPSMYCVQWLVCIFAYTFRRDIVMRIWDVFFVEGSAFLFRVGLGLMHLLRDDILDIDSEEGLIVALEKVAMRVDDPDEVLQAASLDKFMLKNKHIRDLRAQYRAKVMEDLCLLPPPLPRMGAIGETRGRNSFLALSSPHIQVIEDYVLMERGKRVVEVTAAPLRDLLIGRKDRVVSFPAIRRFRTVDESRDADSQDSGDSTSQE